MPPISATQSLDLRAHLENAVIFHELTITRYAVVIAKHLKDHTGDLSLVRRLRKCIVREQDVIRLLHEQLMALPA